MIGQETDNGQHFVLWKRNSLTKLKDRHRLIFQLFAKSIPDSLIFSVMNSTLMLGHTNITRTTIFITLFSKIIKQNACPANMFGMDIFQNFIDTRLISGLPVFISRTRDTEIALLFPGLPVYN